MSYHPLYQSVQKKRVVRDGKKVTTTTSDREGYKVVDGKEVKMSNDELRKRQKAAKQTAKKQSSSDNQTAAKKRQKSIDRKMGSDMRKN